MQHAANKHDPQFTSGPHRTERGGAPTRPDSTRRPPDWPPIVRALAVLVILKVLGGVLLNYRAYFPPDFQADFLLGRREYFWGSYAWAFYVHLVVGPLSLVLGLLLVSNRLRQYSPRLHRALGKLQVVTVLGLVAPSGLWMAYRAEGGPVAGAGFALLAVWTGVSVALGWRAAVRRQFAAHRRWMTRCFLLLCSTVVLRIITGLATLLDVRGLWIDPCAAWVSWLGPWLIFEACRMPWRKWAEGLEVAHQIPPSDRDQCPAGRRRDLH